MPCVGCTRAFATFAGSKLHRLTRDKELLGTVKCVALAPITSSPLGMDRPHGSPISYDGRRGRREAGREGRMEVHSMHAQHRTSSILDKPIGGAKPGDGVT